MQKILTEGLFWLTIVLLSLGGALAFAAIADWCNDFWHDTRRWTRRWRNK